MLFIDFDIAVLSTIINAPEGPVGRAVSHYGSSGMLSLPTRQIQGVISGRALIIS